MNVSNNIELIVENGCISIKRLNQLKRHIVDEAEKSDGVTRPVAFVIYSTRLFLTDAVRRQYKKAEDTKFMLLCVREFQWLDLLSLSELEPQIYGWCNVEIDENIMEIIIHTMLFKEESIYHVKNTLTFSKLSLREMDKPGVQDVYYTLTAREAEVLAMIAEGSSNKEIAEVLCISENTAKTHVRKILEKLQFDSRTKAALYAIENNLLNLK